MPRALLGGDLGFFASSYVLFREAGLDDSRLSIGADWERQEILPSGLVLRGFSEIRTDLFIHDDFGGIDSATDFRFSPLAGVEARFPLIHESPGGVTTSVDSYTSAGNIQEILRNHTEGSSKRQRGT